METRNTMRNALIKTVDLGEVRGTFLITAKMNSLDFTKAAASIEKQVELNDLPNYMQKALCNSDEAPLKVMQDMQMTMKLLPVSWFFPEGEEA